MAATDPMFHLGTFTHAGRTFVGLVVDDAVTDLARTASAAGETLPPFVELREFLGDWDRNFDMLQTVAAFLAAEGPELAPIALNQIRPRPPLGGSGKLLYAAANYAAHVAGLSKTFTPDMPVDQGAGTLPPLRPYMFGKMSAPTGAFDDILLPPGLSRIDWEAELMVVVGKAGHNIPASRAGDHIAGYMTTNDVSCRDLTWREDRPSIRSDWLSGKSFDSFAPIGPYFTPRQFVPDHANLAIRLWVNGEIKQDGNSRDMTFGIEEQIEYASRRLTLLPGDLIATGTPAGTGQERLEFLRAGDVVEAEVEFCGRQHNKVVAGSSDYVHGSTPSGARTQGR